MKKSFPCVFMLSEWKFMLSKYKSIEDQNFPKLLQHEVDINLQITSFFLFAILAAVNRKFGRPISRSK